MKAILSTLLWPAARVADMLQAAGRLWAFTRLRVRVPGLPASAVVLGPAHCEGPGEIVLGRQLLLYPGLYLEARESARIEIGDRVVISRGTHIVAFERVVIGSGTMIGEYASIRDAHHRFDGPLPLRESGHNARAVEIGREVWIGRGATILAGVRIGDRAVVGANSVVTRDVAAGAVVGGAPARALERRAA